MGLIAQSAFEGDLTDGATGLPHQPLRVFNALACDVVEWGQTEGCLESPKEMSGAGSGDRDEFGTADRSIEVLLDVCCQALRLPTRQLAVARGLGLLRCATALQIGL